MTDPPTDGCRRAGFPLLGAKCPFRRGFRGFWSTMRNESKWKPGISPITTKPPAASGKAFPASMENLWERGLRFPREPLRCRSPRLAPHLRLAAPVSPPATKAQPPKLPKTFHRRPVRPLHSALHSADRDSDAACPPSPARIRGLRNGKPRFSAFSVSSQRSSSDCPHRHDSTDGRWQLVRIGLRLARLPVGSRTRIPTHRRPR